MANKYEISNIKASSLFVSSSRYKNSDVVYYGDNKLLTINIYKRKSTPLSKNDKFTVITPGTEYRPDLLSYKAYGTPDFWWKIMEFNGIKDIYDFKSGLNIRLPMNVY
jgi:hypothetical protein